MVTEEVSIHAEAVLLEMVSDFMLIYDSYKQFHTVITLIYKAGHGGSDNISGSYSYLA